MSDKLNEAIQEIAVRHGVVLGKDDPILILQTMHERLLEDNRKAQQQMLVQFREEIENISSLWKNYAKEKAENILNTALSVSKESMAKLLRDSTSESVQAMKKMIADSLAEAQKITEQTRKFSRFALLATIAVLGWTSLFWIFIIIK